MCHKFNSLFDRQIVFVNSYAIANNVRSVHPI